jgi:hypothetical protein
LVAVTERPHEKEQFCFIGQKKYPLLTPSEVVAILTNLKFVKDRQDGFACTV